MLRRTTMSCRARSRSRSTANLRRCESPRGEGRREVILQALQRMSSRRGVSQTQESSSASVGSPPPPI